MHRLLCTFTASLPTHPLLFMSSCVTVKDERNLEGVPGLPGRGGGVEEGESLPNSSKSSSFEITGLRIETRGNYSRCPKCKKDIKSTFIIRHIKLHDVPIEKYECPEKSCGLHVNRINNLFRHLKVVHKSQKPYICKYCKKRYARAEELRTHFAGHKAERERHRRTEKLDRLEDDGCVETLLAFHLCIVARSVASA